MSSFIMTVSSHQIPNISPISGDGEMGLRFLPLPAASDVSTMVQLQLPPPLRPSVDAGAATVAAPSVWQSTCRRRLLCHRPRTEADSTGSFAYSLVTVDAIPCTVAPVANFRSTTDDGRVQFKSDSAIFAAAARSWPAAAPLRRCYVNFTGFQSAKELDTSWR